MYNLPDGRRVIPRTELTYPGLTRAIGASADADGRTKMSRSAASAPVDHIMGDMEDACPYELKGEPVRAALAESFRAVDFGKKVVTWRPNNLKSGLFEPDVEYMMRSAVDRFHGIVLPKSFSAAEVEYADHVLSFCERVYGWTQKVQIEALIETPGAVQRADDIASALAGSGRGGGLIFGIADYASFLGIPDITENQHLNFAYAKQRVVTAAKAFGLHAVDNVYLKFPRRTDPPEVIAEVERGLREKNTHAANIGMDGTWVIHPSQAAIANECFTPSDEAIRTFKRVLDHSREMGGGAIADPETGEMIDDATLRIALTGLAKAVQAGKVDQAYLDSANRHLTELTGYDILTSGL
jgi:citrate lyase beta subunit